MVYENVDSDISRFLPSQDLIFRRLVFQRSESLVQSEAVLTREESPYKATGGSERKKSNSASRPKKKGTKKSDGINPCSHIIPYFEFCMVGALHILFFSNL